MEHHLADVRNENKLEATLKRKITLGVLEPAIGAANLKQNRVMLVPCKAQ
jgi:hypothetical protein